MLINVLDVNTVSEILFFGCRDMDLDDSSIASAEKPDFLCTRVGCFISGCPVL